MEDIWKASEERMRGIMMVSRNYKNGVWMVNIGVWRPTRNINLRTNQVRTGQVRTIQVGKVQVRYGQVRTCQVGISQVRTSQSALEN